MSLNSTSFPDEVLLDPVEQAAILLLSMGEDSAAKVMGHMSRDELLKVSHAMAHQSAIRSVEAQFVLQCFFNEFRAQSGISGASRTFLQRTLDKALGGRLARSLLDSIYGDEVRTIMQRLQWIQPNQLARFLSHEHIQMRALFIAFLPADIASATLAEYDKETQHDLLYRIANLTEVNKEVAQELKDLVERCIEYLAENSSSVVEGEQQAADIINRYQGNQASLMEALGDQDSELVDRLKNKMYEFGVLTRQSEAVRTRIIEEIPVETLALALKGADTQTRKSILSILPRRMRQSFESEIAMLGKVSVSQVKKARDEIMDYVRDLNETGQINLQLYQEKTVE
ncbi:flagellar motor switch protein FliG [Vibrio sp. ZSDE26]|uniref:Flagellar motor switch protein FliG n=1 Tax=Vibrio amylolyticus TaxID=2847292 RepID=A0A9X1XHQ4_9VIBR|nr:FliG C-terminal domain-containing protein [Vibrio amylolyticus]MCK6263367.1 flagellar motor switch protein FliG [Vibrio amylolyticus]